MNTPSDSRIPLIGPRGRYLLLQETPTWIYHKMASSGLTGNAPVETGKTADTTDPVVSAGVATYSNLTDGGLFTILYKYKRPLVVEAIDSSGTPTIVIRNVANSTERAAPAVPFKVSAGEVIKVTCPGSPASIGLLVREDIPAR